CYQYPKGRPNSVSIHRDLLGEAFKPAPDALEESGGRDAVEHTVVEAQAEIHHRSDGYRISVHHNWPLYDRVHRQDARLRRRDDRHEGQDDPLLLLEAIPCLLTEAHDVAHLDLGHRPGMRDGLLAPDHVAGDGAPHRAERDGSARHRRHASGSRRSLRSPLTLLAVRGGRLSPLGDIVLDVFLADPSADPGAADARQFG